MYSGTEVKIDYVIGDEEIKRKIREVRIGEELTELTRNFIQYR